MTVCDCYLFLLSRIVQNLMNGHHRGSVLLIVQHRMSVTESSALNVLAAQSHSVTFVHQSRERQLLRCGEVNLAHLKGL